MHASIPSSLRLPLRFDAARLREDLAQLGPAEWVPHFNTREYEGEWSGVALRSVDGQEGRLYPDPAAQGRYADTPTLARCAAARALLASFPCPVQSARFLKLAAGSSIREHRDYRLGWADGEVRLHVPVVSHPEVRFFLAGRPVPLAEGECWYLDVNQPHRVDNRSPVDRVHLVFDCVLDDWLRALFLQAAQQPREEGEAGPEALLRLRAQVLESPALQQELLPLATPREFAARLVQLGAERGCYFTGEDVQEALRRERRSWLERWV